MPEYKPSFVVFPGAFHPASCLDSFIATLQAAGFPAEAHSLRSLGNPDAVVDDDEAYMRSVIDPHITAGKDVVVVVHSFAGFGGSSAISGIDKRGREARGEQGGVLGIIYLTAFVPLEGDSLYGLVQCRWPSWMQVNEPERLIYTKDQTQIFYNDCDPAAAAAVTEALKGHSIKALYSSPRNIGWAEAGYNGYRAYIRCTQDNAIYTPLQELFTQRTGVEWIIKSLETSHSPFLSVPDQTVRVLEEIVDEFLALR